jgi:glycine dehydrogenase
VADSCFAQTIDVLRGRAEPLGIGSRDRRRRDGHVHRSDAGALVQTPDEAGCVHDFRDFIARAKRVGVLVAVGHPRRSR